MFKKLYNVIKTFLLPKPVLMGIWIDCYEVLKKQDQDVVEKIMQLYYKELFEKEMEKNISKQRFDSMDKKLNESN